MFMGHFNDEIGFIFNFVQSAEAVEYTDCRGVTPTTPRSVPVMTLNNLMVML